MDEWRRLTSELDQWAQAGSSATLWWRDDDAIRPTPALERLFALGRNAVPLTLAVVPEFATEELAQRLAATSHVTAVQHGWSHRSHSPQGQRSVEFGTDRELDIMAAEITLGKKRMHELFSSRFIPAFVPPWNRINRDLAPYFPALGMTGLSTFGARRSTSEWPVTIVNAHVDPILWQEGKRFAGDHRALAGLTAHLNARRLGTVDQDEPTGLLTHHLVHGEDIWHFLSQLFSLTLRHPAVRWLHTAEIFASGNITTRAQENLPAEFPQP